MEDKGKKTFLKATKKIVDDTVRSLMRNSRINFKKVALAHKKSKTPLGKILLTEEEKQYIKDNEEVLSLRRHLEDEGKD